MLGFVTPGSRPIRPKVMVAQAPDPGLDVAPEAEPVTQPRTSAELRAALPPHHLEALLDKYGRSFGGRAPGDDDLKWAQWRAIAFHQLGDKAMAVLDRRKMSKAAYRAIGDGAMMPSEWYSRQPMLAVKEAAA